MNKELNKDKILKTIDAISDDNLAILTQELSQQLAEIYDQSQTYFFQILYRIDIDEQQVLEILQQKETDPFEQIAKMIINRQLQKINTKKKYSGNSPDWDFDI